MDGSGNLAQPLDQGTADPHLQATALLLVELGSVLSNTVLRAHGFSHGTCLPVRGTESLGPWRLTDRLRVYMAHVSTTTSTKRCSCTMGLQSAPVCSIAFKSGIDLPMTTLAASTWALVISTLLFAKEFKRFNN